MATNEETEKLKFRCKTDLFFLTKEILGRELLTEQAHQCVCDFFVQKDPTKTIKQQSTIRKRLLLYPRGSFKSTINVADCVQWIIAFPNVSIMILTAADDLATSFVDEVKQFFIIEDETPTLFQKIFPEFCIDPKKKGMQGEGWFNSPARKKFKKEPTIFASSIESNNSGKHVDVLKCDDVLSEQNTETIAQLKKVGRKLDMANNLLMSWGYEDIIGTRYNPEDAYGKLLELYHVTKTYGMTEIANEFKYLCKPAWWLKDTDFVVPTEEQTLFPENIELLFPEVLTHGELRRKQNSNKENFASQQMNDPMGSSDITFTRAQLVAITRLHQAFPKQGRIFAAWDLAYSTKKKRDYTVGAIGLIDNEQRIWVLDIIRGRYQPSELPFVIAKSIQTWNPEITAIEDSPGARWLQSDITRHAQDMHIALNIDWFVVDRQANAKECRVKNLEALMMLGKLQLSAGITCMDDLYKEFMQFPNGSHDDIPDAISHLQRFIDRCASANFGVERQKAYEELKERDLYDRLYQQGIYAPSELGSSYDTFEHIDPVTALPY